ncbi:MAG TPA: tetratricopeptide repeat protein [Polyangia bacterium]|nr:tetratricopeptide repeat protein [Polyangia bacterium]
MSLAVALVLALAPVTRAADGEAAATDAGAGADRVPACATAADCSKLGSAYSKAIGVKRDFETAARLFEKACDLGSADDCLNAAQIRQSGLGARRDEALALRLFQRVCDKGDAAACRFAAEIYEHGSRDPGAVPANLARAAELYDRACGHGDGPACDSLAGMYRRGQGVKKDRKKAVALQKRARDLGFDPRE